MRSSVLAVLLLCCTAFAQVQHQPLQLAPNPNCPNSASFCRMYLTLNGQYISVLGVHNGVLYGYQFGPNQTVSLYSSTTFAPETWNLLGQFQQKCIPGFCDTPIEIVFGSGTCSSYKYIYTNFERILRAGTDWNFSTDVGSSNLPSLPPDTGGRPGSFAISTQPSGTTLYYGNYNDHSYNGNNPPYGAYVWSSTDCGDHWSRQGSSSPYFFGAREVHAINTDPASPSNVYVTVDDECSPDGKTCPNPAPLGLWRTADNGNTFTPLTTNSATVGIDFVFPFGSNRIFFETDNCSAYPNNSRPSFCSTTEQPTGTGPLLSWDKLNGGAFGVPALWQSPVCTLSPSQCTNIPAWGGSGGAINLTSDQNIFLMTSGESGAFSFREGLWYFAPPSYSYGTLLEDLAPPIFSLVSNVDGTATATTFAAHNIQPGDSVTICDPTQSSFNASGVVPTVTGANTFTYVPQGAQTCPQNVTIPGAFASKQVFFFPNRTVQVSDATTGISYIYSNYSRMPRPQFLTSRLPASGSALTSFVDQNGGQHWVYEDVNTHVDEVSWTPSGGFVFTDLTAAANAPLAAAGSALSAYVMPQFNQQHFVYFGANQHLYQILYDGTSFTSADLTSSAGAPAAAPGSALTTFVDSNGGQHWAYLGTNGHVYQPFWVSATGFGFTDLTAAGNASLAVAGSALTSYADPSGAQHWLYFDSNEHINQIFLNTSGMFTSSDLTASASAPAAAPGSPIVNFIDSNWGQHWIYLGTNQHVYQAFWLPSTGFGFEDRTGASGAPVAAASSWLSVLVDSSGGQHFIFEGVDQHVYQAVRMSNNTFFYEDRTAASGALSAIAGSPLSSFLDSSGGQHFIYFALDQHVFQANWTPNNGFSYTDLSLGLTP